MIAETRPLMTFNSQSDALANYQAICLLLRYHSFLVFLDNGKVEKES